MGDRFQAVLDVTIVYPAGTPTFWQFMCGRMDRVVVRVRSLPVPRDLAQSDYAGDASVRAAFAQWLQQMWLDKDRQIAEILSPQAR